MAFILKQILADKNVSQHELSRRCGVTQAMISKIIAGKQDPSIGTLEKMAAALDLEVPDLFDRQKFKTVTCPHCGEKITVKVDAISHIEVIR